MIDTPNTHVHNRTFSWLGTDTLIKSGGIKLIFYELKSPLTDILVEIQTYKTYYKSRRYMNGEL